MSPRAARLAGLLALVAAALQAIRLVGRIRHELRELRSCGACLRTEWTDVRGPAGSARLRLRARVADGAGTGLPPIVLVHGFGVGSGYLVPLAGRIAPRARVYVPELPGHGCSDHDVRPLTVAELATALASWMNASGVRAALLVGHSLGCQVAAEVAARRPELVAGLVLVGPTSDPSARTAHRTLARGFWTSLFDRPTYLALAAMDYRRAGARLLGEEMQHMVGHRLEDVLPLVAVPTRVVRGGRDGIVSRSWAEAVARLAAAPPPLVVPGWGHAVHYDSPGAVAQVALELASTISAPAADTHAAKSARGRPARRRLDTETP